MHGPTKAKYEYFLKVSEDARTLEGHWTATVSMAPSYGTSRTVRTCYTCRLAPLKGTEGTEGTKGTKGNGLMGWAQAPNGPSSGQPTRRPLRMPAVQVIRGDQRPLETNCLTEELTSRRPSVPVRPAKTPMHSNCRGDTTG